MTPTTTTIEPVSLLQTKYHVTLIVIIFNLLWCEFIETNATFRSASTDLGNAYVSTNSLQSKLTINLILGAMNNIFHIMSRV